MASSARSSGASSPPGLRSSQRRALDVAKSDLDFAERKASIERQAALDATGMEATQARLMKLHDLFPGDSAMARLWWSNSEPDRLLRPADGGKSGRAVSMVTASHADSVAADKITSLVERFLADLDPDHRKLLIMQLGKIFTSYQRAELAEELQQAG